MKHNFGKFTLTFIITLILAISAFAFTAFAAETEIDGVIWKYDKTEATETTTATAIISGVTINLEKTSRFDIPSEFVVVSGTEEEPITTVYTVVGIKNNAFKDNKKVFGEVTFPSTLTAIGESAFQGTYILGDIVIPETVNTIGKNAFYNCFGITTVTIPNNITVIKEGTFYKCHSLSSINTKNITTFEKNAFFHCNALLNVDFAKQIELIGETAFSQCYSLHGTIDLSGVKSMNLNAFKNCTRIESFVIPNLDVDILPLFEGCTALKSIVATKDNPKYFTTDDGVLLSGTGNSKTLILYPIQKEDAVYEIPVDVVTIGKDAFKNNQNIEKIIISNRVSSIQSGAFSYTSLKSAYIPGSITQLVDTFRNCSQLEWVVLEGSVTSISYDTFTSTNSNFVLYTKNDKLSRPNAVKNFIKVSEYKCVNHLYGYFDVAPTCDTFGQNQCVVCDGLAYIKELGHIGPIIESKELSCTTDEYYIVDCSGCNQLVKIVIEECAGHTSSFKSIGGGDTPLIKLGTCLVCRETYIESYTPFGAPCQKHENTENLCLSTAACRSTGLDIVYCADCGALVDETKTPKTDCVYDESKRVVINSTCSINGQVVDECSICGIKKYTTLDLAPHSHKWYTVANNVGYEYSSCSVCGTFESHLVDYSVFNKLISQISKYYETYYAPDTVAMLKPILNNKDLNLTQEAVDYNVELLSNILSNIRYNVKSIPVVFIEKTEGTLVKESYTPAKFYIAYIENGEYKIEAIEHNGEIKIRGNSTANSTKYPYNIKFSSKVDLFNMGAGKKYSLLANLYDQTLIRNALAFEFADLLGLENTSKYVMCEVYYNGEYDGVYMLTTPVEIGENRVSIDSDNDFLLEIKSNHGDDNTGLVVNHDGLFKEFSSLHMLVEEPEKVSAEAYSSLISSFNQISLAIYSGDWETIQKWVDVESMAKFYLLHDYLKAVDIGYDSTQFYIKDGKLYGGPVWDWDFAIGNKSTGTGQDGTSWGSYNNIVSQGNTMGVKNDSTTGFWANSLWHTGQTGYFLHFYKYSPEFIDLVTIYLEEYDEEMTLLYADIIISKKETKQNIIDKYFKDDAYTAARIRNWEVYTISYKYGVDQLSSADGIVSYNQAIDHLRNWLEKRHKWLKEAYGVVD